jgi:hypothetical protein
VSVLVDKIRKARETKVEAGGFAFIVRRPTALEMIEIQNQPRGRAILPFVIGWEGVKEADLIPGGDPHPLAFDADVCREWLTDRLDLLAPVAEAVFAAFAAHDGRLEDAKKN